jgi:phospholipase C
MPPVSPIKHVVILFKENHAFDNYFGTFPGANGATMAHSPNPPPHDPNHTHKGWLNRATGAVRQQFVESDIPTYFAYARQFTLCDNYFTDVAGPSTPNHLMVITADSPIIDNPHGNPVYDLPSLPASLDAAGLTWGNYGGYAFGMIKALAGRPQLPSAQFATDAAAAKLPALSWVYAPNAFSEHPPDPQDKGANPPVGNVTNGMQWSVSQVNAIVQGGLWPQTAIFITWDDWGGWYDHVTPPEVEKWTDGTQFRYGTRVGCLVLSPYAKAGYISQTLLSHVSLVNFCATIFGLKTLNARDAAADGMTDCFDFTQKPALPQSNTQPTTQ